MSIWKPSSIPQWCKMKPGEAAQYIIEREAYIAELEAKLYPPFNLPFERLPQCACDPGFGPAPEPYDPALCRCAETGERSKPERPGDRAGLS